MLVIILNGRKSAQPCSFLKAYKHIYRYKHIMAFLLIIHLLLCCSIIIESVFVILLLVYWYHSLSYIRYLLSTYYVSEFFRYWRYSGKKKKKSLFSLNLYFIPKLSRDRHKQRSQIYLIITKGYGGKTGRERERTQLTKDTWNQKEHLLVLCLFIFFSFLSLI